MRPDANVFAVLSLLVVGGLVGCPATSSTNDHSQPTSETAVQVAGEARRVDMPAEIAAENAALQRPSFEIKPNVRPRMLRGLPSEAEEEEGR